MEKGGCRPQLSRGDLGGERVGLTSGIPRIHPLREQATQGRKKNVSTRLFSVSGEAILHGKRGNTIEGGFLKGFVERMLLARRTGRAHHRLLLTDN